MVKEIAEPVKNIKALCDRLEACRNQVMQAGVHYIKALCDRLEACRNQVMQADVHYVKALCDRLEACRNQVMQAGVHYVKALCDRLEACRNQVMQADAHLCKGEETRVSVLFMRTGFLLIVNPDLLKISFFKVTSKFVAFFSSILLVGGRRFDFSAGTCFFYFFRGPFDTPESESGFNFLFYCSSIRIRKKNHREKLWNTAGVTKRCRLSWLTNSTLVYEPKCGGGGGLRHLSQ
jgi:hypothetical protein